MLHSATCGQPAATLLVEAGVLSSLLPIPSVMLRSVPTLRPGPMSSSPVASARGPKIFIICFGFFFFKNSFLKDFI